MITNQFIRDEVWNALRLATEAYKNQHDWFMAQAATAPLNAIAWGEKLVEASSQLNVIQRASYKINEGEHYQLDGVLREFIRVETLDVLVSVGDGDSSSAMANAVHHARQRGRAEAIENLNCIVPAIRASLQ